MKRDSRIEILRCLFMFGICLLHAITQGGHCSRWIDNLLSPSVTGFVVISAWFGVKFRPSKVLRLAGVAAWCSICVAAYFRKNIALGCFQTYWFLWAYVLMMLFAPVIDSARLSLKVVLPLLLGVFVWGFACDMPIGTSILPHTAGLTAYSGITFVGIYAAVRAFKQSKYVDCLTTKQLIWIAALSAIICECGFYKYNSPFSLSLTLSLVLIMQRIPPPPRYIGEAALLLSPSLFAVYMYHTGAGFNVLKSIETYLVSDAGLSVYITHVVTALLVFWGCVAIDIPRRVLCRAAKPVIDWLCGWVDAKYEKFVQ